MQRVKLEKKADTEYSTLYRDEYSAPNIIGDGPYQYASRYREGEKEVNPVLRLGPQLFDQFCKFLLIL